MLLPGTLLAESFLLPENGDDVIWAIGLTTTRHEDTLSDLAWAYDQGYREIRHANPGVDPWLPGEGTEIIIPSRYILPDAPRKGIVINVPEMRLYYFPKTRESEPARVYTYPISIGRRDWSTPHGVTRIISKIKDPTWTPPKSIKKEHAERGDPLPDVVPAGPDNPLGQFAMRLGIPGYLIHGTNKPYGLGMRVTHGCIRLYPKDIKELFEQIPVGTPVRIVDQPYKAGWLKGKLYIEAHPPLEESDKKGYQLLVNAISKAFEKVGKGKVDWNKVKQVAQEHTGMPVLVGVAAASQGGDSVRMVDSKDIPEGSEIAVETERPEQETNESGPPSASFTELF